MEIFEKYQEFFDHPAKRALFMMGMLTGKLVGEFPLEERGKIYKKITKNFGIPKRQEEVRILFRRLNEYDLRKWEKLREEISMNLMAAGNRWPLSKEEIGFYIALGLSISDCEV